ncbi:MAG: hypothetical protein HF982_02900 [Desulfobacteraceae bacterium]|nr:hypothetical protein [Desulfobacteraceae bacterium]MBC2718532.1 HipA N-terminal domain-containing protein [Desulfobacteraceae bacterium]
MGKLFRPRSLVGAVSWDEENRFAIFEFDPGFLEHGLEISPVMMPIDEACKRRLPSMIKSEKYAPAK